MAEENEQKTLERQLRLEQIQKLWELESQQYKEKLDELAAPLRQQFQGTQRTTSPEFKKLLNDFIKVTEARETALHKMGVEGSVLNAYFFLEDRIPEDFSIFYAIIDYAIEQYNQGKIKTFKEIASLIISPTEIKESEFAEDLKAILGGNVAILQRFKGNKAIEKYYMLTGKLSDIFFNKHSELWDYGDEIEVIISKKGKKYPIIHTATVDIDDSIYSLISEKHLSIYEKRVHDAIVSIYIQNQKPDTPYLMFSTRDVYRAMTGIQHNEIIAQPETLEEIEQTIEYLAGHRIKINLDQEIEWQGEKCKLENITDNILHLTSATAIFSNGDKGKIYQLSSTPILYNYALSMAKNKKNAQITDVSPNLLNCKKVSNTKNNQRINTYLLQRIEGMKGDNNLDSNVIKLETLYKVCEIDANSRTTTNRARKTITEYLNHFKGNGYIKDWAFNKKGKAFYSISIFFENKKANTK